MKQSKVFPLSIFAIIGLIVFPLNITYADDAEPQGIAHKVVIHVSSNDLKTQKMALNNAVNLQKHYGMDNVAVEIVAYGPGISLMTEGTKLSTRVSSLSQQEIRFSACANTINNITSKKGVRPVLTEGGEIVPAGVARIIELQESGYTYVRP